MVATFSPAFDASGLRAAQVMRCPGAGDDWTCGLSYLSEDDSRHWRSWPRSGDKGQVTGDF